MIIIEDSGGDCSVWVFISAGGLVSGHGGETALSSVHRRELCCRTSVPPCKARKHLAAAAVSLPQLVTSYPSTARLAVVGKQTFSMR